MMKAKITAENGFRCCPDGHTDTLFEIGSVVEGQIAEWAVAERAASRIFDKSEPLENKATQPTEKKRRGRPPKKVD